MPGFIGLPEIILFGIVALLIFGPKKLPEIGKSLGKGMREFKDSVSGDGNDKRPEVVEGLEALRATETPSDPFADLPTRAEAPVAHVNGTAATPAR